MIIINIIILILLAIFYVYSLRRPREWLQQADKKEHKLYALYPLADFILSSTGLDRRLQKKEEIHNSIRALKVTSKPEQLQRLYWCGKVAMMLIILPAFCILSILGQISAKDGRYLREGGYLLRPEQGQGTREVELTVDFTEERNKEGAKEEPGEESNPISSRSLTLRIPERRYTEEELEKHFREAEAYLRKKVVGKNSSSEAVYENLYFCEQIPGTGIKVKWEPENIRLIQSDGTVNNGELQQSIHTGVTVILIYGERRTSFTVSFEIMPKQVSEEEEVDKKLVQEIVQAEERTAEEHELKLPDRMDPYDLRWSEEKDNTGMTVFFLGLLLAAAAWIAGDRELQEQMKRRREQLLMDYPEIINKFTLLVNAGMTARQAWYKISQDYSGKGCNRGTKKRYAYEEMLVTAHELKLGISEGTAYEQYGRRIGLLPYIKFSSLVSQNLKKGNKGFTEQLRQEALEAFGERKETAKRLGEEAGTKLLAPMMLMLILVFIIILVPAFLSFQI